MFAIRQQTHTQVVTISDVQAAPQRSEGAQSHVWGTGTALNNRPYPLARPFSRERDEVVRITIETRIAEDRERRVQDLFAHIRTGPLPAEMRTTATEWATQFEGIEPTLIKKRAYAVGFLVTRIIHPALDSASPEARTQLLSINEKCLLLLQRMLPAGRVEDFLMQCETGLREERLIHERVERLVVLNAALSDMLPQASHEIQACIARAYAAIRAGVLALQDSRRMMPSLIQAQVESLGRELQQLERQLNAIQARNEELGIQDTATIDRLRKLSVECRKLLLTI